GRIDDAAQRDVPVLAEVRRLVHGSHYNPPPSMDFIGGQWVDAQAPDGVLENRSPADLSMVLSRHPWAASQVEAAVAAARRAVPADRRARRARAVQFPGAPAERAHPAGDRVRE